MPLNVLFFELGIYSQENEDVINDTTNGDALHYPIIHLSEGLNLLLKKKFDNVSFYLAE